MSRDKWKSDLKARWRRKSIFQHRRKLYLVPLLGTENFLPVPFVRAQWAGASFNGESALKGL